jgi:hypothetical protein
MTDYVYVLGFSDGTVKVGRTSDPQQRISRHKYDASMRSATLEHSWVGRTSIPLQAELALIRIGRSSFPKAWGSEYFRASFDDFMAAINRLMHRHMIHVEGRSCEASPFPRQIDPRFHAADVARGLRVPVDYVRHAFGTGELPHDFYGRVLGSDLTAWIKSSTKALTPTT